MIQVDIRSRKPLYQQLVDNIEELAARGFLQSDSQLPSVRTLAMELSINPNTIQRAYGELEKRGVIYSLPGRGSFIGGTLDELRESKRQQLIARLSAMLAEAYMLGITQEQVLALCHEVFTQAASKNKPPEGKDVVLE